MKYVVRRGQPSSGVARYSEKQRSVDRFISSLTTILQVIASRTDLERTEFAVFPITSESFPVDRLKTALIKEKANHEMIVTTATPQLASPRAKLSPFGPS